MGTEQILSWVQGVLLLVLVVQAAVTDLRGHRIYNWPVLCGIVAGFALSFARGGMGSFSFEGVMSDQINLSVSVGGFLLMAAIFLLAYLTGGMGAGDVKLAAAVGALAGLRFSLWVLFHSAFAGALLALFWLIFKKDLRGGLRRTLLSGARLRWREKDNEKMGKPVVIPYAVAICAGTIWAMWYVYGLGGLPFFLKAAAEAAGSL